MATAKVTPISPSNASDKTLAALRRKLSTMHESLDHARQSAEVLAAALGSNDGDSGIDGVDAAEVLERQIITPLREASSELLLAPGSAPAADALPHHAAGPAAASWEANPTRALMEERIDAQRRKLMDAMAVLAVTQAAFARNFDVDQVDGCNVDSSLQVVHDMIDRAVTRPEEAYHLTCPPTDIEVEAAAARVAAS